jgi:hypothetical protein
MVASAVVVKPAKRLLTKPFNLAALHDSTSRLMRASQRPNGLSVLLGDDPERARGMITPTTALRVEATGRLYRSHRNGQCGAFDLDNSSQKLDQSDMKSAGALDCEHDAAARSRAAAVRV